MLTLTSCLFTIYLRTKSTQYFGVTILNSEISLLPIDANDNALFRKLYLDPSIVKMLFVQMTIEDVDAWFERVYKNKSGNYQFYKICISDNAQIIGLIGLIRRYEGVVEYGILLDGEHRFRGVASAVTLNLLNELELKWSKSQIIGRCIPENIPMINVFKKCGFEQINSDGYKELKIDAPHLMFRKSVC